MAELSPSMFAVFAGAAAVFGAEGFAEDGEVGESPASCDSPDGHLIVFRVGGVVVAAPEPFGAHPAAEGGVRAFEEPVELADGDVHGAGRACGAQPRVAEMCVGVEADPV